MEKFSLEKWLQNKSRKVVTRDGREVEILKTNRKDGVHPIIFTVLDQNNIEQVHLCNVNGICTTLPRPNKFDLFFADEEEELTEFESKLADLLVYNHPMDIKSAESIAKRKSKQLLDLARETDWREPVGAYENGYEQGKADALKNLPKWRRSDDNLPYSYIGGLCNEFLVKKGYYIKISDLETLPKEE